MIRKKKKREREMFRQMAHLKCRRQGISNFNETLDLAHELFLIYPRKKKKNLKMTKIEQVTEKPTFSKLGWRKLKQKFISAINSYKLLHRAISYQNEN